MTLNLDKSTWKRVSLGDVAAASKEKVDPGSGDVERYIAGEHMDTDDLKIHRWGEVGDGYLGPAFHRRFHPGQVLYGSRRTYLRKVAVAEFSGVTANTTFVIETKDPGILLQEFLPFVMTSEPFHAFAIQESKGSVNPYVNWSDIARYEFDLPRLDEQKRLADLLWAVEHHHQATGQEIAKLRSAREGLIDEFVRSTPQRSPIQAFGLPGVQAVQVGPFGGSLASRHFTEAGARVLKIQNVTVDGEIDLDYSVFVSNDHAQSLERYKLRLGDSVIVAQGATVGKAAIIDESVGEALISQHLIRVRLDPAHVLPKFVSLMIRSADFQRQIDTVRTKSTRDGLNTDDVARFQIPAVDLAAQGRFLGVVETFDRSIRERRAERATLAGARSALLADVFRGAK